MKKLSILLSTNLVYMQWIIHTTFLQELKLMVACLVCQRQKMNWTTWQNLTPPKTGAFPWWASPRKRRSSRSDGRSILPSTRKRMWSTHGTWILALGGSPILFKAPSSLKRANSRVRWSASMTFGPVHWPYIMYCHPHILPIIGLWSWASTYNGT